jgi:hypothetical protein
MEFDSQQGQEILLYSTASRPALGLTQPIPWVLGVLSSEAKRPGREADHSPPSTAEIKMWSDTFTPPYVFNRNNFTCSCCIMLFTII